MISAKQAAISAVYGVGLVDMPPAVFTEAAVSLESRRLKQMTAVHDMCVADGLPESRFRRLRDCRPWVYVRRQKGTKPNLFRCGFKLACPYCWGRNVMRTVHSWERAMKAVTGPTSLHVGLTFGPWMPLAASRASHLRALKGAATQHLTAARRHYGDLLAGSVLRYGDMQVVGGASEFRVACSSLFLVAGSPKPLPVDMIGKRLRIRKKAASPPDTPPVAEMVMASGVHLLPDPPFDQVVSMIVETSRYPTGMLYVDAVGPARMMQFPELAKMRHTSMIGACRRTKSAPPKTQID